MPWYLYIDDATGALRSVGDQDTPPPPGVVRVTASTDPRDPAWMYDPATRTLIARPAKVIIDRLDDLISHPDYSEFLTAWNALNAANKNRLRNALIRLLGRQRYRATGEPIEVG